MRYIIKMGRVFVAIGFLITFGLGLLAGLALRESHPVSREDNHHSDARPNVSEPVAATRDQDRPASGLREPASSGKVPISPHSPDGRPAAGLVPIPAYLLTSLSSRVFDKGLVLSPDAAQAFALSPAQREWATKCFQDALQILAQEEAKSARIVETKSGDKFVAIAPLASSADIASSLEKRLEENLPPSVAGSLVSIAGAGIEFGSYGAFRREYSIVEETDPVIRANQPYRLEVDYFLPDSKTPITTQGSSLDRDSYDRRFGRILAK